MGAVLPSEVFTGNLGSNSMNQADIVSGYNRSYAAPDNPLGQISWFKKMLTVLFVPFAVPGIPLILSCMIGFLNYMCAVLGGVYIYDKIRGI